MLVTYQNVAGATPTNLYVGNNIQTLIVLRFIISNSDSNNSDTVSVYLVPPGGVASINNAVIHGVKIAASSYIEGSGGFVVPPKWSIQTQSSSPAVVVCTLSGELTGNPPNQFGPA